MSDGKGAKGASEREVRAHIRRVLKKLLPKGGERKGAGDPKRLTAARAVSVGGGRCADAGEQIKSSIRAHERSDVLCWILRSSEFHLPNSEGVRWRKIAIRYVAMMCFDVAGINEAALAQKS